MQNAKICPVILSGGSGTRLWPLSHHNNPKQLLALTSNKSLLQETLIRSQAEFFDTPVIVTNEHLSFNTRQQLKEIGIEKAPIILEPEGRNTAPSIALAAFFMQNPKTLMLVLPADHIIKNTETFIKTIKNASDIANNGSLVTFGITPTYPATGFGYIEKSTTISEHKKCYKVKSFTEKPDLKTAETFVKSKQYLFNSGMFLFSAESYLSWLQKLEPEMYGHCKTAMDNAKQSHNFIRPDTTFLENPSKSVDYAIMEHADNIAVIEEDFDWSDIGTWRSLWEIGNKDAEGNVKNSDNIHTKNTKNSYIYSNGQTVTTLGLENAVVIATGNAMLVANKDQAEDVKQLAENIQKQNPNNLPNSTTYRPWGNYKVLENTHHVQVKQLTIDPGKRISLQYHNHRSEHWVVIEGTATVTKGDKTITLEKTESIDIPIKTHHRLENKGDTPLIIIEVQTGSYLGEDDIIRIEDDFNRA